MSSIVTPSAPAGVEPHLSHKPHWWRAALPLAIGATLAVLPPLPGLAPHAWYYSALFAAVIAALVTEPLPNPAVGLTAAAALSRWTLFGPEELARPNFNVPSRSISWALSGFASTTVWRRRGLHVCARL